MVRYAFVKLGMTSIFTEDGKELGVTILKLQNSKIIRHENLTNSQKLIVVEYSIKNKLTRTRGWKVDNTSTFEIGSCLKSPDFKLGQKISITGISKGKGFQDVITRHHFSGGPGAHGSRFHRCPGSIGMRTEPGRVIKGKKLPGRHGGVQRTVTGMKIAFWSPEEKLLAIAGGIPGSSGSLVYV